jgi:hypothetical protein
MTLDIIFIYSFIYYLCNYIYIHIYIYIIYFFSPITVNDYFYIRHYVSPDSILFIVILSTSPLSIRDVLFLHCLQFLYLIFELLNVCFLCGKATFPYVNNIYISRRTNNNFILKFLSILFHCCNLFLI